MGSEHIFRAYDVRGTWGDELDVQGCLRIGRGLGSFLKADLGFGSAAIGCDVRTTSRAFHSSVIAGLLSSGIDVLDAGMCGFGVAMYAGMREPTDASVYITASHLGPEWNGMKVYFGDGVGFPEEHITAIGARFESNDFISTEWGSHGRYSSTDALRGYVRFWRGRYGKYLKGKKMTVGVDPGGGAMCLSAPQVLSCVGADVRTVNAEIDPYFTKRRSEPKPKELGALRDMVLDERLAFGVAFDGDGDRAVVVDDTGRFLSTDRLGTLIARSLVMEKGGGTILANVESSMVIEDVLVPLGARIKRIKVGHTFLTLEAKKEKALFGVERSGHIIVPRNVLFDDAMVAPLEIIRVLSKSGRALHELVNEVPEYPSASEAYDCPDKSKFAVLNALTERLKAIYGKVDTQDGARVDLDRGWALIRCSNTSPVIRLTVEARSEKDVNGLRDEFGKVLREEIGKMTP